MNFFSRRINKWISVGLLASMSLWLGLFYFLEARKIVAGDFSPDYQIYYELTK